MLTPVINAIDRFIEKQGELTSFFVYPLVFIVIYEVIMRYVFNSPTVWGFEATTFAYGIHYMFGLSYTENQSGHVKVDIITNKLSPKGRAVMGVITYFLVFIPVYSLMAIAAIKYAATSTLEHELNSTSWAPPVWPIKIIMAFCFLSLFVQGLSTLLKHLRIIMGNNE